MMLLGEYGSEVCCGCRICWFLIMRIKGGGRVNVELEELLK